MQAFYHHLAAGEHHDPIQALHRAGRETRARWNHPFYWGGFGVHGA
jgi:CHAT domain-containing protein